MKRFLIGLVASLALVSSAFSESFYTKSHEGAWSVHGLYAALPRLNPMCVAEYVGKDKTRIQLIKDLADGEVYIVAYNPKWSLSDPLGTTKPGRMEFRGGSASVTWPQDYMIGPNIVAFRWLTAPFFIGFSKSTTLKIVLEGSGNQTVSFPLKGTGQTVKELAECVDAGLKLDKELFKNIPKPGVNI